MLDKNTKIYQVGGIFITSDRKFGANFYAPDSDNNSGTEEIVWFEDLNGAINKLLKDMTKKEIINFYDKMLSNWHPKIISADNHICNHDCSHDHQ